MLDAARVTFGVAPGRSAADAAVYASSTVQDPNSYVTAQHHRRWLLLENALQTLAQHSLDPELISQSWEFGSIYLSLLIGLSGCMQLWKQVQSCRAKCSFGAMQMLPTIAYGQWLHYELAIFACGVCV